jgi:hypothetical protein
MAGCFRFVQQTYNIMVQFFGGFESAINTLRKELSGETQNPIPLIDLNYNLILMGLTLPLNLNELQSQESEQKFKIIKKYLVGRYMSGKACYRL